MQTDLEFSTLANLREFPGASLVTRHNASDDPDQATAETVQVMQSAAVEDSNSPQVWAATRGALTLAADGSRESICEAVYRWICSHVKFRSDDPVLANLLGLDDELDLLIRPARLITMSRPAEDCDGFTMLCCSMLLAAGVPCEVVTIKADQDDPSRFSHVYCQSILENGAALVMDCSQGAQHGFPLGWEAPEYYARKEWGVIHPTTQKGLHGLGDGDFGGEVGPADTVSIPTTSGPGINWGPIIQQLTAGGLKIAQMQSTPVGYVQQANGAYANYGPGGSISQLGAGISPTVLMIGGGLLLAVLAFGGRK